MNTHILSFAILFLTATNLKTLSANENINNNRFQKIVNDYWQKTQEANEKLKKKAVEIKNAAGEHLKKVIDEMTQQTIHEMKQEIVDRLRKEPVYQKAITDDPRDIFALIMYGKTWAELKLYQLPKHAFKTGRAHYIANDKKLSFSSWIKVMKSVNKEINDEMAKKKTTA